MVQSPQRTLNHFLTRSLLASSLSVSMGLYTSAQAENNSDAAGDKAGQEAKHQPENTDFSEAVDAYFDDFFARNPSAATYVGFHQHDHELEDYRAQAVADEITATRTWLARFQAFTPASLSQDEQIDRQLLLNSLQGQLLEQATLRRWAQDPDRYSSGITASVFSLMSRNFAPAAERLKAVIAREKLMPAVFEAARANLENPPKVFTEVAIDQLPGIVSFFEQDVPQAFAEVQNPALKAEFAASNAAVIAALNDYASWLKSDLLPRSGGDYRLGAENFRKKLLYDEMVDLPLDRLLEIGYADLRRNQKAFQENVKWVDPNLSPAEILEQINRDYPPPDQLLQRFRDVMGGMRDFIEEHQILTLPSRDLPQVVETPPFMRALTFAAMDTPGPFENKATEAYFDVTLPEPDWSEQETAEYMSGFNEGVIVSTALHEALPGHYVQFLWTHRTQRKVPKLIETASNFEGWAHYCEQMMLDEGYGNGDPKLRLGQLQDALLRNARFIVGIKLHTGQMSFEEGVDFFVKEGYQSRTNGERETLRGTSDPTYLYYTLGKLQLLKLRADYQKLRGKDFSLREFHDRFLQQGAIPIALIRRIMLGSDSPSL